ncbi:MAG TPA: hypothetical protein PKH24_19800 [Sedimentisphaerales bacterium]|nr:hypothetical protein [Sedimentisphaerales bacterium]HNU31385.1 hypothetical protein [Sedimentisphaerales bacterium]
MKRIVVNHRVQIKQLLYCDRVLAVRDDACPAFGGFALWWYDKKHGVCRCCRSHWADQKKQIEAHTLDEAAAILWRERDALFLRDRRLSDDHKLMQINHLCNWRPNACGLRPNRLPIDAPSAGEGSLVACP